MISALRFTIIISLSKKYYRSLFLGTRQKSWYGRSFKRGHRSIWKFWSSAKLWTEHSNFCFAYLRNIQPSLRRPLPCTAGSSKQITTVFASCSRMIKNTSFWASRSPAKLEIRKELCFASSSSEDWNKRKCQESWGRNKFEISREKKRIAKMSRCSSEERLANPFKPS